MIETRVIHKEKEVIYKSIDVKAPKEKVWDVLMLDHYNRIWYSEFNPGTYAETDWKLGSKVFINDGTGYGLVGRVVINEPLSSLKIEYIGFLEEGREDLGGEDIENIRGFTEAYNLYEEDNITTLSIEQETSGEYLALFLAMWDKALLKIKELAEKDGPPKPSFLNPQSINL